MTFSPASADRSSDGDLPLSPDFRALIASDRVNARLRRALAERALPVEPPEGPTALDRVELATLRAVVARVVPQPPGAADLAVRIASRLASGEGDGWRFAILPADDEAYRRALRTLDAVARHRHARPLSELPGPEIDALLQALEARALPTDGAELDADGMVRWFEDLRASAVQAYMALPSTLDRIGFSGIGAGGDGGALRGFTHFGIGREEDWEPRAHATEVAS